MSDWREEPFNMKVSKGGGESRTMTVMGHTKGLFALDERNHIPDFGRPKKVWCLTHLPTGYAAVYLFGSLKTAKGIADEIADCTDWDFTDPTQSRARGMAVKKVKDAHPDAFAPSGDVGQAEEYPASQPVAPPPATQT